jgi:outer membrane protein, heavy metal efflux system
MKKITLLLLWVVGLKAQAAGDSLKVTLQEVESAFLQKNALLLAKKFDIEATQSQVIQAKLWDNPTLSYEQMAYNNSTKKLLPILGLADKEGSPPTTQQAIQIQQLFLLSQKRTKRTQLAETATKIAENTYFDVLRALKFELRSSFYDLHFLQKILTVYGEEITSLNKTVESMKLLYDKGIIPLKDVTRLRALAFALETERRDILTQIIDKQANIRLVVGTDNEVYFVPQTTDSRLDSLSVGLLTAQKVLETALENRPDLKMQQSALVYEQQNLTYQKALRTPDLRVGALFDRSGSSVPNYFAVNFQMDLPFFNKNQGNIKVAERRILSQEKQVEAQQNRIGTDIQRAYQRANLADKLYKGFDPSFIKDFDKLLDNVKSSYAKQVISMLEFIDFYESYKNSIVQMNRLQNDRVNAFEELNFVTGTELIKTYK